MRITVMDSERIIVVDLSQILFKDFVESSSFQPNEKMELVAWENVSFKKHLAVIAIKVLGMRY